jgi:hypothetical protein
MGGEGLWVIAINFMKTATFLKKKKGPQGALTTRLSVTALVKQNSTSTISFASACGWCAQSTFKVPGVFIGLSHKMSTTF